MVEQVITYITANWVAWAKQAETSAYKAYEKLGGNDVAHAMHERFMQLPLSDGNLETERIH